MKRGRLLVFSGVDCAGKSTQIELLAESLRAGGSRVRTLWLRPGYSSELDRLRRLARRVRPSALPSVERPADRARAFARRDVRIAWVGLAVFDMMLQYAVKLRASLAFGETVICDRYIADAVIDLELRFPELALGLLRRVGAFEALCPRPDRAFLLMLPKDEVIVRTARKREPFPDTPTVRDARYEKYQSLAETAGLRVIDGSRSREAIHAEILGIVREEVRSGTES